MEPFIGEIRLFAGSYAPVGWALCNGQLVPLGQNTALYSLIGTTYGGDGKTNFALPNLKGRAPMHAGAGPGLTPHYLGEAGGKASVPLVAGQMPAHSHVPGCYDGPGNADAPTDAVWAGKAGRGAVAAYAPAPTADGAMNAQALSSMGSGKAHNNRQPYLGLNFIIALNGIFPQRP